MYTIFKYTVQGVDEPRYAVPSTGKVVHVAAQDPMDDWPTVWIAQDHDAPLDGHLFIAGTGHPLPGFIEHVGSAVCAGGALVWHVYRVRA